MEYIYIYYTSMYICGSRLQVATMPYKSMHFHLRKLCLTISHETSNRSKVPLDHSGFFSSYKPNLHPLAMRQETNLKTVFNPTFKCLSVYINMHVGIIYIYKYILYTPNPSGKSTTCQFPALPHAPMVMQ